MATDIIARGMITEYKSGANINFAENEDGSVTISASGSISSEDSVARDAINNHKSDTSNPHNVTPAQIGLGNVDNTSDLDKPISTAVQQAIDNKADKTVATTSADGLMSAEDKSKLDSADDTYALKSKYGDTTIDVGRKADTTVGFWSTAEGSNTTASGQCSHAEGDGTTASGGWSHAEGSGTIASKQCAHAEGVRTTASGANSHAEGQLTTASGANSHAGGWCTEALHDNEVSYGKYNKSNNDTLFSIGDGTATDVRHNAFEITKTGGKLHDKDIATTDLIPTSLPANGGNADTVDGLHASDFMPINGEVRKYGTIRMNGSDGIRVRHIDGNDEIDGALYLNYNSPNATIYMNGTNTAIHSGNIGSQSVNYANSAGNADTARQVTSPSSKVKLYENEEGGNLELVAPDGVHLMQMDLYNNESFRVYFYDGSQLYFPADFNFNTGKFNINGNAETATSASNADTVDGLHAYNMATLSAAGNTHGTSLPMYCKHNVLGDNRFYIGVSGGYERSVAVGFAESAGYVNPNVVVKSLTFPNVSLNESGWGSLGITTSDYNIIGCTCTSNDRHARVYRGNNATGWFVYVTQQYPTPGVAAANEVVNVVVFYI